MPDGAELAVLTFSDVTESREKVVKLTMDYQMFQSDRFYNDPLTGLPNLNYLHEYADERVHALRAKEKTPMLYYMDVNFMQSYNSRYGFAKGDELLLLVKDELKREFPDALIARGADDHFILISSFEGIEASAEHLSQVNRRIKQNAFGNTSGIQAGIFVYEEGANTAEAIDHARNALKSIKSDLNEICRFYSHEDDVLYWSQRYIVESFDRAIRNGWIKVYYQGIMRLESGKGAALEALARWIDPNRGIISPEEFIPVLEKYHLLFKLDLYMMEQVCREIPVRVNAGLPLLPVSMNFSAQDFDYIDIPSALNELYDRYDMGRYCPREYFIVEITEHDMATATERFHEQLHALRRDGYKLWLDDFGSGYSSLNVFSSFDVGLIKFDMNLLRNLDAHNGANRRIIKAMIGVARELGIHTLVEGLETESQRLFLQEIGCELVQGFRFHRPEPLDSILYRRQSGKKPGPCETAEERALYIQKWLNP